MTVIYFSYVVNNVVNKQSMNYVDSWLFTKQSSGLVLRLLVSQKISQ